MTTYGISNARYLCRLSPELMACHTPKVVTLPRVAIALEQLGKLG
ncbi:MAG: hypothetical protein ACOYM4_03005 [Nodosilinea sp.]